MIAENLKAYRKSLGWTQQELAERAGMKQPVVSIYERGVKTASVKGLERLAKALGCSVAVLVGDKDGASLDAVAEFTGLSVEACAKLHNMSPSERGYLDLMIMSYQAG